MDMSQICHLSTHKPYLKIHVTFSKNTSDTPIEPRHWCPPVASAWLPGWKPEGVYVYMDVCICKYIYIYTGSHIYISIIIYIYTYIYNIDIHLQRRENVTGSFFCLMRVSLVSPHTRACRHYAQRMISQHFLHPVVLADPT